MPTLDELTAWCEESRKILGNKSRTLIPDTQSSESQKLAALSKKVHELLVSLNGNRGYKEGLARYERLVDKLRTARQDLGKAKEKERAAKLDQINSEFTDLKETLASAVQARDAERERLATLRKARDDYVAAYRPVRQQVALLKVMPKANAVNVERTLDALHESAHTTAQAYETARKGLPDIQSTLKNLQAQAEKLQKDELAQWAKKPEGQAAIDTAEANLAEMAKLKGIGAILGQYRTIIDTAKSLGDANSWVEALQELAKLKSLPNQAKAQQESTGQLKILGELPQYKKGLAALASLEQLLPADEFAKQDKLFYAAVDQFLSGKLQDVKLVDAAADAAVAEQLRVDKLDERLAAMEKSLHRSMMEAKSLASETDLLGVQALHENFKALKEDRRIEVALGLGDKLASEIEGLAVLRRLALARWNADKGEAKTIAANLAKLADSGCPAVQARVPTLTSLVLASELQKAEAAHDWTQLVERLDKARTGYAEVQAAHDAYASVDKARVAGDQQVRERETASMKSLEKLAGAIATAIPNMPDRFDASPVFEADIRRAVDRWASVRDSTSDAAELEAARVQALADLAALDARVAAALKPGGLQPVIDDHKSAAIVKKLEAGWPALEQSLVALQAKDNDAARRLTARAAQIKGEMAADPLKAQSDAALLRHEIMQIGRGISQRHAQATQDFATYAAEVLTAIETARKATEKKKGFAKAFEALVAEHKELVAMGRTTNADALAAATEAMADLHKRAAEFGPGKGNATSIDQISLSLDRLEERLEGLDKKLAKDAPLTQASLAKDLAELRKAAYASSPAKTLPKITPFDQRLDAAEAEADAVAEVRKQYDAREPTVKASLKIFRNRKLAPTYGDDLQARYDAATKLAGQPAKLYQAHADLQRVGEELDVALNDPLKAAEKEGPLLKAKLADQADQAQWEKAEKLFNGTQLGAARAAVKANKGDKALLLELQRMAKLAHQSAASGDFAKAVSQINLTLERSRQIIANPHGPALGSRNNLPADAGSYRKALAQFRLALDKIVANAKILVPDLPVAVETRLKNQIDLVRTRFDDYAFDAGISRMIAADDDDARRAAREELLARVRAVQGVLANNPQVKGLLGNPMAAAPYSLAYRGVSDALVRLDANVSRSCN